MAVFEYVAKDASGNKFEGVYTDIETVSDLRGELSKMGYTLVKSHRDKKSGSKKTGKVRQADIVAFAFEFAGMYSAGLSIVRCLETFEEQSENSALKRIMADIRQRVETGSSLKEAFEKYIDIFSPFFIGMIEAGESGGKLGETLQMAAVYLEDQSDLKRKVRSAFAYPIVVTVMCVIIVTVLVIFVIPVFQKLYTQLQVPLPLPTLILISISHMVRNLWWLVLPILALTVFGIKKLIKNPQVRAHLDSFKLKMPIFGPLNRLVLVNRFIRTFSMMASAGVSFVDSIELAKQVANNHEMNIIADTMQENIMTGSSFAVPMSEFSLFPPMLVQLAAAGEEAGIMPEMLSKGVEFMDKQIDRKLKGLLMKIEPIMSLLMGTVVGGILLGVYLPMFDYMSHIK